VEFFYKPGDGGLFGTGNYTGGFYLIVSIMPEFIQFYGLFIEGAMDGKRSVMGTSVCREIYSGSCSGSRQGFLSQIQGRMPVLSCEKVILNDSFCSRGRQHGERMDVSVSENRIHPNLYY
jgi:hypothetical protein